MGDKNFDIPVTVETAQTGRFFTVTRVGQAADFLVHRWPEQKKGPKHRAALQALMDVMQERKAVAAAREAFTAAAKEADIFIREGRQFG
ncbi:DUF982 domain-containing protein [Aquamicrobium soli]|uniref:DUF982 domain-containing protein n=1 Tax=Aquamicrobium soli TaxID=1811518 RepID=A0ABV7KAZ2_9HYPH